MAETITTEENVEPTDDELEDPLAEEEEVGDDWDDLADEEEASDDEDGVEADKGDASEEALDELEAEELEMLTEDEAEETLVIDEAAALRDIRRAEIAMNTSEGTERLADEFQCQSCFLVKKTAQLADKRRQLCRDCI